MKSVKRYSLSALYAYKELLNSCKKIADENSDLIALSYSVENFFIRLNDRDPNSGWHFTIGEPFLPGGLNQDPSASYTRIPKNEVELGEYHWTGPMELMSAAILSWLIVIKKYNNFSMEPESEIQHKYAEEMFADFKITIPDEDAETAAFDDTKQELYIKFLEFIELSALEYPEQTEEIKAISSEAKELKNSIPRLTKNNVLKRLSNLAAKIRMQGPDVAKGIFKIAKDETIKFIFKQILEGAQHLIQHGHNL